MKEKLGTNFNLEITLKRGDGSVEKRYENKEKGLSELLGDLMVEVKKLKSMIDKSEEN